MPSPRGTVAGGRQTRATASWWTPLVELLIHKVKCAPRARYRLVLIPTLHYVFHWQSPFPSKRGNTMGLGDLPRPGFTDYS